MPRVRLPDDQQGDLFAARQAPPAVAVERPDAGLCGGDSGRPTRRKLEVGKLTADQAHRARAGLPHAFLGYWFKRSGAVVCATCWTAGGSSAPESLKGQGYAMPIYPVGGFRSATVSFDRQIVGGTCSFCPTAVAGEVMEKATELAVTSR